MTISSSFSVPSILGISRIVNCFTIKLIPKGWLVLFFTLFKLSSSRIVQKLKQTNNMLPLSFQYCTPIFNLSQCIFLGKAHSSTIPFNDGNSCSILKASKMHLSYQSQRSASSRKTPLKYFITFSSNRNLSPLMKAKLNCFTRIGPIVLFPQPIKPASI